MAKGPAYTEEEQKALQDLAKKGGGLAELAQEFVQEFGPARSGPALQQKIRKLIIELAAKKGAKKAPRNGESIAVAATPGEAPRKRGRPPKVNTAQISDVAPAPKKRGRPPKSDSLGIRTVSRSVVHVPSPNETLGGNGRDNVTVDLGEGLVLVGSKKRVGEMLQRIA